MPVYKQIMPRMTMIGNAHETDLVMRGGVVGAVGGARRRGARMGVAVENEVSVRVDRRARRGGASLLARPGALVGQWLLGREIRARIAAFARAVDAASEAGDAAAQQVIDDAADELATSAMTALDRSGRGPGEPARVSWVGGVMSASDRLRNRFVDTISRRAPEVSVEPPHGPPFDGVRLLTDLDAAHPLAEHVYRGTSAP